jgi:hypothetical protein
MRSKRLLCLGEEGYIAALFDGSRGVLPVEVDAIQPERKAPE